MLGPETLSGETALVAALRCGDEDAFSALVDAYGAAMHRVALTFVRPSAVADEVVYAVLRRHDIVKPSLNERVEAALEGVRPMLASHGGDVELVKVKPPSVEVRFIGACEAMNVDFWCYSGDSGIASAAYLHLAAAHAKHA